MSNRDMGLDSGAFRFLKRVARANAFRTMGEGESPDFTRLNPNTTRAHRAQVPLTAATGARNAQRQRVMRRRRKSIRGGSNLTPSSRAHMLIRVLVFVIAALAGAGYYALSVSSTPHSGLDGFLKALPVVLVFVGLLVLGIAALVLIVEQARTRTQQREVAEPVVRGGRIVVKRVVHGREVDDKPEYSYQSSPGVTDESRTSIPSSESLLIFRQELGISYRELMAFAEAQSQRIGQKRRGSMLGTVSRTLTADEAINEVELMASKVRGMGALLYQISEKIGTKWVWVEDLAQPGMYQPLQPIVLPSQGTKKLNADQLKRLTDGILEFDKLVLLATSRAFTLTRSGAQNDRTEDELETMRLLVQEYFGLTQELLGRVKTLRNIIYEQYVGGRVPAR